VSGTAPDKLNLEKENIYVTKTAPYETAKIVFRMKKKMGEQKKELRLTETVQGAG